MNIISVTSIDYMPASIFYTLLEAQYQSLLFPLYKIPFLCSNFQDEFY